MAKKAGCTKVYSMSVILDMLVEETGGTMAQVKRALISSCIVNDIREQVEWLQKMEQDEGDNHYGMAGNDADSAGSGFDFPRPQLRTTF